MSNKEFSKVVADIYKNGFDEHMLYLVLERELHELVDMRTKDLDSAHDELIRQKLNDEFRFWRYK